MKCWICSLVVLSTEYTKCSEAGLCVLLWFGDRKQWLLVCNTVSVSWTIAKETLTNIIGERYSLCRDHLERGFTSVI